MGKQHVVYLSLGSNIGDRRYNIQEAIRLVGEKVGMVFRRSSLVETEPWGFDSTNRFVNACIACQSNLTPQEVLTETQEIERQLGRTEKTKNGIYHDRSIDIDILLYDNLQINSPSLKIPHPHMLERDFVMIPLREIL
ncbi:MAG: 2-amino-4-hydroxy-6-hydroxymethyldihydropteridine diphosphokinase [Prevotella sp.]|nr:2-amino-4-hydroxy-6-hydroxymethyldihydropteridine diphosphokinase [Prevotella sp.]MDD3387006.1 2-amino-4-hydroxy-6-hydroxymethyldihydropteridine diphosphokinase [Prevotella sp.]MDD4533640.1 2-amino-4-hydroxy-6-hydroxymethyldihydropteridine diphosphokinase [Prevotella sp.]MDT3388830.1 2-amino-4-hydroxy-6-hydroxymethyldihydropteridine diphosphokinase [Bacteroidota bacterium]